MDMFALSLLIGENNCLVADVYKALEAWHMSCPTSHTDWQRYIYGPHGKIVDQAIYDTIKSEQIGEITVQSDEWGVRVNGRLKSGVVVRWSSVLSPMAATVS